MTAKPKTVAANKPKPAVATKGTWDFSGKDVTEVPMGLGRANNTQKLPFPWDEYAKSTKVSKLIEIPVKFWVEGRGFTNPDDITAKKCRERIQRAFYGWRSNEEHAKAREKFSLAFADQFEKGVYTGTHMYFQVGTPPVAKAE